MDEIREKMHELNPYKDVPYTTYYGQFEKCFDQILDIPEIKQALEEKELSDRKLKESMEKIDKFIAQEKEMERRAEEQ